MHLTLIAVVVQMRNVKHAKVNLNANGLDGNQKDLVQPHVEVVLFQSNDSAKIKQMTMIANCQKT